MSDNKSFFDLNNADENLKSSEVAKNVTAEFGGWLPNIFKVEGIISDKIIESHNYLFSELMMKDDGGPLSKRLREMIAVVVAQNNECPYCVFHHDNFLQEHLDGDQLPANPKDDKETALLEFASKVTQKPYAITQADHDHLTELGWTEKERLHCLLIASYFNFANRIVSGSGVPIEDMFTNK